MTNPCGNDGCTKAAIKHGTTGPPRRYCSDRCRQAAYRARLNNPQTTAEATADPLAAAVDHLADLSKELPMPAKIGYRGATIGRTITELERIQGWQRR